MIDNLKKKIDWNLEEMCHMRVRGGGKRTYQIDLHQNWALCSLSFTCDPLTRMYISQSGTIVKKQIQHFRERYCSSFFGFSLDIVVQRLVD